MTSPEPVLSAAERTALADLEAALAEQDPVLDETLRTGTSAFFPRPQRLAVLLLVASLLVGVASLVGGTPVVLAVLLGSVTIAVGLNLYRQRRLR